MIFLILEQELENKYTHWGKEICLPEIIAHLVKQFSFLQPTYPPANDWI